jgi:hypothetical protein
MKTFEKLDVKGRYELLRREGERVLTVSFYNFCVTLYTFNGCLVESYFNIRSLKVEKVEVAQNADLAKYMEYITIHEIYWML